MWILKNSKEPFIKFKISFIKITLHSTPPLPQIYDFSTFYITFPHDKIKSRLFETIENCFFNKDGFRKFTYLDTRLSAVSIEVIILSKYYGRYNGFVSNYMYNLWLGRCWLKFFIFIVRQLLFIELSSDFSVFPITTKS